ncbi:MAG: hypothetical protein NZM18_08370, partial [Thermoflexales bacterium]|nr:hypothetical protein [Thermoflexales bacterium]
LVLLGVCLPLSRRESMARLLLAVTICAPIIFWLGLSNLIENYPSFRYVIFIVPAIHVAIAHAVRAALSPGGIAIARRLSAWRVWQQALGSSSLIAVVGSTTFGLGMTFVRSPTWQDDWRGMAHYLRQQWQPGDAIVININTPEALLPLYLRDLPAPILTVNEWAAYPVEEVRRTITERYKRVWYANTGGDNSYQNPEAQAILRPYLLRSRIAFPARTTIIELLEYDLHPRVVEVLPATASVVDSVPTDRTVIAGYEVEPGNPYHPQANFRLALYWRRGTTDDPAKHSVAVRLAAHGRIWLDWTLPARLAHHPESWHAGTFYRMSYIVPVPPGLLPQSYTLELQVRSGDKNELVQAFSAALPRRDLDCCIRVARQADAEANPYWRARDVTLVRKEHPTLLRPGEPLPVALTWQAMRDDLVPWETRLMLKGLFGGEVAGVQRIVGSPDFPATAWPAGELMRDQYVLDVLRSTQPGWYCLQLERWRGGRRVDATFLGLVRVEDYPRALAAVQAQHPTTGARVGELSLLGYSVNAPLERGRTYDFITHWRVEQVPTRDGVLFLHMFGPDGRLVSQDDNPPIVDGTVRSTLTYRPGEHINQVHRLALPADAPAGEYRLLAGVYDREGGLRWPAQQDGRPARDDLILLGVIKLN